MTTRRGQNTAGGAARHDVAAVLAAAGSKGVGADGRRATRNDATSDAQLGVGPGHGVGLGLGLGGSRSLLLIGGVVLLLLLGVDGGWFERGWVGTRRESYY